MSRTVTRVQSRFLAASRAGGLAVVALGSIVLTGRFSNSTLFAGVDAITTNAAICFVALGAGLLLLHVTVWAPRYAEALARRAALLLGAAVGAAAALTILQGGFGWNLGIEGALFREATEPARVSHPVHMSPEVAAAFVLSGASIVELALGMELSAHIAQTLAAGVGVIALSVLVGYLIDLEFLYRIGDYPAMSVGIASAFLVLAVALLAARADRGWMREFTLDTVSSRLARRFAFTVLVAMLALTMLKVYGARLGWFDRNVGAIFHAMAVLVLVHALLWSSTRFGNRTELRAARLTRVRAILGAVNASVVRAREREALLRDLCRILTDLGGYELAWIGFADRGAWRIVPVTWAGQLDGLLEKAQKGLSAIGRALEPVQRAVASARPVVVNHFAVGADISPLGELARLGLSSTAVFPLVVGERHGAVVLHSTERRAFDRDEMKLLEEVVGDIAYGIDHIEKAQRLDYIALHNTLTRLANRTLFMDRLSQHLAGTAQAGGKLALLLVDVARFRLVNTTFGRQVGDELLRQIGSRLEHVYEPLRLARITGGQFAAIIPRLIREEDAVRVYERIAAQCFGENFQVGDRSLMLEVRAGIAIFPRDGGDPESLYRSAESALFDAKKRGVTYAFHDPASQSAIAERLLMETALRSALANRELRLHYQPRVNVRTRKIAGAEALMRWQSRHAGPVSPAQFIPVLEETGLICEAGAWALAQAAADALRLAQAGVRGIRLAVNVSPVQLRERDFAQAAARATDADPGPGAIELEITESAAMEDVEQTLGKLRELRELGFRLAIDDFGTGYSSFAWLAKFPVQSLKIDRAFVGAMLKEAPAARVVRTITDLAHSLGMTVVAEGVETEAQAALLAEVGCDEMQGFLISRPLPYEDFEAFVRRSAAAS